MFVELPNGAGVGKLEDAAGDYCSISVFYSIQRTETLSLPLDAIKRAYLSSQTRVYVKDNDQVRVGRVTDYLANPDGTISYEITFPNRKQKDYNEVDLFVRPWCAPDDPADVLAAGGAESQFLHDRRYLAVNRLLKLKSASRGLSAILSAGVDLVPHQISAVQRVLSDPVQRYLLADEVGLGKTIEAGLIVRQLLIDNPETEILVCAPSKLCNQWREELVRKLRLDQFGEAFECCTHEDLVRVGRAPDVLIVDEAHHLVPISETPLAPSAYRLRELALDVQVLLLLSATPPLGHEQTFLGLLNLLDPVTYPLEDPSRFRSKLEQRREVGRILLSLDPTAPAIVLRQRCAQIQQLFPEDSIIQTLAPRLAAATREASGDLSALCTALRDHIADCYRIHHRVIRSRRADAKGWEFRPRGPGGNGESRLAHVRCEGNPAGTLIRILEALEEWRFAAVEETIADTGQRMHAAMRYREILEAISSGACALHPWLSQAESIAPGEAFYLNHLRERIGGHTDRAGIETMVESTQRLIRTLKAETAHPKIAAFAHSTSLAAAFYEQLSQTIGAEGCCLLTKSNLGEALEQFKNHTEVAVLVSDQSGEEGLNLGFADAIVHLDLPMSAARLEQRIGRLDRYGRRQEIIRHRLLIPSDEENSPWLAWYEILADGFEIFNRSVSDVQFLLPDLEKHIFEVLLRDGPEAAPDLIAFVRARIAEERRSQDEQYALDRLVLSNGDVNSLLEAIEEAEVDEDALGNDIEQWLVHTLGLKKKPCSWPKLDPFVIRPTKRTLIPRHPWLSQLNFDQEKQLTWKRQTAVGRENAALLRPGFPLVDMLDRFTHWDDRGTAFITYRRVPSWQGELWIGFKLCFIVEPNLQFSDLSTPTRAELAMVRRAQRYLAPSAHTLYIDANGEAVTDAQLLSILARPYCQDGRDGAPPDVNLASRPQNMASIIGPDIFRRLCEDIRDQGANLLRIQTEMQSRIEVAMGQILSDLERHRNSLHHRRQLLDDDVQADFALIEHILPSIREPAIRLDAMGCLIVGQGELGAIDE